MKNIILLFLLNLSYSLFAQPTFQLAPPLLKYNSIFFINTITVEIKFAQSGTLVHYLLDQREPTRQDPVYTKPITIKNNFTTLKAKAFGNNFLPSESVAVTFIKEGKSIKFVNQTSPNNKYPGAGANTLIDNKGGIKLLSSKTWMGYNCDTVVVTMDMAKMQTVKKVLFNFLQSENDWIFLPDEVIIYWLDNKTGNFRIFRHEKLFTIKETPGTQCNYQLITSKNRIRTNKILINILVKKIIPSWHASAGKHGWMFIDEIKVY